MSIKLSNALCVAVGLLLIAASGYTQVVYETGSIPVKMQNIIMFAYIGFVGVSALAYVGFLFAQFFIYERNNANSYHTRNCGKQTGQPQQAFP